MSSYRTQNRTVLAKVETTAGTDAVPVVGTNAVLIESPASTYNLGTTETREVTGSLDRRAPIPNGGDRGFSGRVYCKGSGTPGTTAPEVDPLLKGCALGISSISAAVVGTATAGTTSTITLAAGASAVDNFYRGAVITITGGSASNDVRIITAYNGTTKVATVTPVFSTAATATSAYSIAPASIYAPISSSIPNVTIYDYHHRADGGNSKLKKTVGGAGNARFTVAPRTLPYWDFDFRGVLVTDTDVTAPAAATYQANRPIPFMAAKVYLNDTQVPLNSLTIDLGNTSVSEDDPNTTFGTTVAGITERGMGGTMRVPKDLESVRNVLSSWQTGVQFTMSAIWGSTSGNRFALLMTNIVYSGIADEDVQGFNYDSLPFRIDAANSGLFWCYW